MTPEQEGQIKEALEVFEQKTKYLLSFDQIDSTKLLALECIRLIHKIDMEDENLAYEFIVKEIEKSTKITQEEKNLTFAALVSLPPEEAIKYTDMPLSELEGIISELYNNTKSFID